LLSVAAKWVPFPYSNRPYQYATTKLASHWPALHKGDLEPWPTAARLAAIAKKHKEVARSVEQAGGTSELADALVDAWRAFHAGDFGAAIEAGADLGPLGATVANKACGVYATYLERNDRRALEFLEAAIERGEAATQAMPDYPNAHYMLAFVLGRYSQRISILKALAQGHATRVRACLDQTLRLEPKHADAHIALGLFHAEVIGKVGSIVGRVTYGASEDAVLEHCARAIKLNPKSAIAHVEYAHALTLLDAHGNAENIAANYAKAASLDAADAMERLDIERAKAARK
jgi:tetratricopeptide (TPR) repeat protein